MHLEKTDTPEWLRRIAEIGRRGELRWLTESMLHVKVEDLISGSCFYYSAGADITPIIFLKDIVHSYIYCDLHMYESGSEINRFVGIVHKLGNRLTENGFIEIQKFNIDHRFLEFETDAIHYSNGYQEKIGGIEFSIWRNGDSLYSLIYINWENSAVFKNLYIKNKIAPRAICNHKPEGGYIDNDVQFFDSNFPEFVLGHIWEDDVLGADKIERLFEKLDTEITYFGDYDGGWQGLVYRRK